ncbi:MAG: aspartate carbamoyltransferase catalytic subunit [Candidatus Krumholzibacteriia bacterium]|nr:aspartate carbamoyltransferase catalytic subunit [bacterium]
MSYTRKDLLDLESLSAEEITLFLDTAEKFREVSEREVKKVPTLRGYTVCNLFFENSTRTRISFELAEKRLSADIVNFSASTSSVAKGETLLDTAENLLAMKMDMFVMRHGASGAPHFLAARVPASVINAGDGTHEHPTQGLLDMLTMRQHLGELAGRKVVIVGDILHSRVARSNLHGLTKLGAEVVLCGPPTLLPRELGTLGVTLEYDLERALAGAEVVNILRIQRERQEGGLLPSLRAYARDWQVRPEHLKLMAPNGIVMHPGPMNRDVEIAQEVANGPRAVILEQVTNGVAVRMAVLYLLSEARRRMEGSAPAGGTSPGASEDTLIAQADA